MAYPPQLLAEGEAVRLDLQPHGWVLAVPAGALVLGVFVVTYLAAALPAGPLRWVVVVAVGLAGAWAVLRPLLAWRTTQYVVTTRRVIVRHGVATRAGRDVPLAAVSHVRYRSGPLERLVGCGRVTLEAAGQSGRVELRHVPSVHQVQLEIARLVDAEWARRRAGSGPSAAAG